MELKVKNSFFKLPFLKSSSRVRITHTRRNSERHKPAGNFYLHISIFFHRSVIGSSHRSGLRLILDHLYRIDSIASWNCQRGALFLLWNTRKYDICAYSAEICTAVEMNCFQVNIRRLHQAFNKHLSSYCYAKHTELVSMDHEKRLRQINRINA